MRYEAYSDASFDSNTGTAGIGVYVVKGEKERAYRCTIKCRTINSAELYAIYLAGILTHFQAKIYTDSQTAIGFIKNEIADKPRTHNQYLNYLECKYYACIIRKNVIDVGKVKGHTNRYNKDSGYNKLADTLAFCGRALKGRN